MFFFTELCYDLFCMHGFKQLCADRFCMHDIILKKVQIRFVTAAASREQL